MKSYSLNKKDILALTVIIVLVLLGLFYYNVFATPDSPVANPGSNFQLCPSNVSQPACYSGSRPTPTFNWTVTGASTQMSYWVKADNNGNIVDGNFPSPEIDTGERVSSNKYYTVPDDVSNGLAFNTSYVWKVAIKDNYDTWSGWTCADTAFTTNGSCNNPPTATNLLVVKGNYCATPSHYFSWTYSDPDGDNQNRFQFQADNNSDFSSPEVDGDYTGLSNPSPTTNNQVVVVAVSPSLNQFGYNTTYYWRVRVYDGGTDSGWVSGSSFTTELHQYPDIDFIWSPSQPSIDQETIFADLTIVYNSTKSAWAWTFEDGNPANSSVQNPTVQFGSVGGKQITLQVTDSDGYVCSSDKTLRVDPETPSWEER